MHDKKWIVCVTSFFLVVALIRCSTNKNLTDDRNLKKIEKLLSMHKRFAFIDLYEKSLRHAEEKYQIKKCDCLLDLSSIELSNENCLTVDFFSDDHESYVDENYNLLISKWVKIEDQPYMPTDNPNLKTTMIFKKAFDFYESDELEKYIDSLRVVFHKKYKEHKLKGIECIE